MKTTNSAQKTEKRSFAKLTFIALTLVLSFVFISMNVRAKGLENITPQNRSLAQMIDLKKAQGTDQLFSFLLTPDAYASELNVASAASFFATSVEKKMEIESWMTNASNFFAPMASLEVEVENALSVEEWMLDNQNFLETTITTENDRALEVEDWMLDESIWGK